MNKLIQSVIDLKSIVEKDLNIESVKAELEAQQAKRLEAETKANEVMNSGATGYGKEIIPSVITADPLLDMLGTYSGVLPLFPGNHGNAMGISEKVPVVGEANDFSGNSERTTSTYTPQNPKADGPATGEITITQGQFILPLAVSKRELNYTPVALEALIRQRINMSAAKTIDKFVLNADDAASGNVNKDGGTPASDIYYVQGNGGFRDTCIADTNTVDVGTLDKESFIDMLGKIDPRYCDTLSDLLWIMPRTVYNKALQLDEVVTYDKFSNGATIATGRLGQIYGIDILVTAAMPANCLATGKVHTSTGNSYGSFLLVYKPALQYGFGQPLEIQIQPVPGKGALMYTTFEFGFGIVYDKAGLGKTAVLGRNVTLT